MQVKSAARNVIILYKSMVFIGGDNNIDVYVVAINSLIRQEKSAGLNKPMRTTVMANKHCLN